MGERETSISGSFCVFVISSCSVFFRIVSFFAHISQKYLGTKKKREIDKRKKTFPFIQHAFYETVYQ